jgi:pyrimidine deaminase RibD-like protein
MGTNRKQLIASLVKDAREFRICGPSDDPDELTAVTSGYYYLVIQFKRLVAPYLPEPAATRMNSIEVEINDIYSTYAAKAELDALLPDVEDALEQLDDNLTIKTSTHHSVFAGDDYKFARQAIDEARKSVSEKDGRPHPMVGAVVVKNGRVLSTAHRGEEPGNHAEYFALEKKLSDEAVSGATVYTTLEPCTTRKPPKFPCAARLIERKVARVVIGMLDPDPRITGRGQRILRGANIITDLFPHDLMTEVEELNREFTRFCEQQNHLRNSEVAKMEQRIGDLQTQITALSRKPYEQALEKHGELLVGRLSTVGKRLMRHLLQNEPLEVGRKFMTDISADDQFTQLTIAMEMGVIRQREVRVGSGMLVRTDYEINPQFVPVLRDLLYRGE